MYPRETIVLASLIADELATICEKGDLLISLVDPDYRYQFVDAAYEHYFGMARESIAGKTIREFPGEVGFELAKKNIDRAMAGEFASITRVLSARKSGSICTFGTSRFPTHRRGLLARSCWSST